MARYIDVENVDLETIHTSHMGYSSKADISDWLNEQPTADVEEVKHGEWIDDGFGRGNMICSVCEQYPVEDEDGNPLLALVDWESPICPNCGAKMDGGKAE